MAPRGTLDDAVGNAHDVENGHPIRVIRENVRDDAHD